MNLNQKIHKRRNEKRQQERKTHTHTHKRMNQQQKEKKQQQEVTRCLAGQDKLDFFAEYQFSAFKLVFNSRYA